MPKKTLPPIDMFTLITRRWIPTLVCVAVKLEIAEHLKDGPRTVEELAKSAQVHAPSLYRLLRALASVGVFAENKDKRFRLTPLAASLQKDAPGSMRGVVLFNMSLPSWEEAWGQLLYGVKTGEVPFLKAHGTSMFEYLAKHPEEAAIFNEAMTSVSSTENPAIAAAYKFSRFGTLVDVGGGQGSLLKTILQANPKLKGVLFDLPSVSDRNQQDKRIPGNGIGNRLAIESGDFFKEVSKGGDGYMMKRVLHDWDDEQCAKILANCRAAMNPKGKVLVIESVIPPGNAPSRGKLVDIQMLVIGGRERTRQEFTRVFKDAGLKLTRVVPTKCPLSIVEGVRA